MYFKSTLRKQSFFFDTVGMPKRIWQDIRKRIDDLHKSGSSVGTTFGYVKVLLLRKKPLLQKKHKNSDREVVGRSEETCVSKKAYKPDLVTPVLSEEMDQNSCKVSWEVCEKKPKTFDPSHRIMSRRWPNANKLLNNFWTENVLAEFAGI